MKRFQDRPKAEWTLMKDVVSNDGQVKRSIYFSKNGGVKITRHTDKGERNVIVCAGSALEDLAEMIESPLLTELRDAMSAQQDEAEKTYLAEQAAAKAAKLVQKATDVVQAAREELARKGFTPEQINALLSPKAS